MGNYYFDRINEILKEEGVLSVFSRGVKKLISGNQKIPNQNKLYKKWIEKVETLYLKNEPYSSNINAYKYKPLISILMPVYNVDPQVLEEAIKSVEAQWYENWELCIYDDASTSKSTRLLLEKFSVKNSQDKSSKIKIKFGEKNGHISFATNQAFSISEGEYLLLMDNDDLLRPNALYELIKVLNDQGQQDLVYFDEDKLDKFGERIEPFFKPDFSAELMWSMMYPTHALYSRSIFEKAGKMRQGFEGSQDYDLVLRVMELTNKIFHIPWILYTWRKVEGSTADKIDSKSYALVTAKKALQEALTRRGLKGKIINDYYPFITKLAPKTTSTVEIIIPIKDKVELLERAIKSIDENTTWKNTRITIVDHESAEEKTLKYLQNIQNETKIPVQVLKYKGEYNFSAINNFAVKQSDADFVLFLNNDVKIITRGWIINMLAWAEQVQVGAVVPKLLYANDKVQHAGIVLGAGGVANHVYYKMPKTTDFYFNHLHSIRNYSALTAACMLIEKKKFEKVDMFNEELPAAYNDVDLCLKLIQKGFRNVYIPYVEVIHYESKSRDAKVLKFEDDYMLNAWPDIIAADPFYNPNLSKDIDKAPLLSVIDA